MSRPIYRAVVVIYSDRPIPDDLSPERLCKRGASDVNFIAYWDGDATVVSEPFGMESGLIQNCDYLASEYFEERAKA